MVALQEHIVDMFSGIIDEGFFQKREVIANVHLKIGLSQEWYIISFESIFKALIDTVKKYFQKNENIYMATKVINQPINLEFQVVLKAYNNEMNRLKEKLIYIAFHDKITGLPKRNKLMLGQNKKFCTCSFKDISRKVS